MPIKSIFQRLKAKTFFSRGFLLIHGVLGGTFDAVVNLVIEVTKGQQRYDAIYSTFVVTAKYHISCVFVQIRSPVVQSAIVVDVFEFKEFGDVD